MAATDYRDPSGFSLQLADSWQVRTYERGLVRINSSSPAKFMMIIPILGRTANCAASLQRDLAGGWAVFPDAADVRIEPINRGAVARFQFQQRQSRSIILCAETSSRTAMMYVIAAPAAEFAREQPVMVAMLKSFRYGGRTGRAPAGGAAPAAALPSFVKWREPNEGAFTLQIPEGWKAQGGIQRNSNTDIRSGVRIWSPDGTSMLQFSDVRLDKCLVPGQQQTMRPALGGGYQYCPYQTGVQVAEMYLQRLLARDLELSGVEIVARQDRPDLSQPADQRVAQMGLRGFQHSYGEIQFSANRRGVPVEGRIQGMTQMVWSPDRNLLGGNYTTEVKGFVTRVGNSATIARIGGHIEATCEHNYQWVAANRQAANNDVQMTMNYLRASAEAQQKAFWERMGAADRRAAAVGDLMSGTVRLKDAQGNQYEAKGGSNYYFYDEEAGRRTGNPNDAVLGTNVYPPMVDLRPLEVIR
jgi:hypothetical protein